MYKFFGEPLKEIKGALSGKVIFRFDHKGEYFTDDPEFIERAKGHFDHIEMEAKEIGERVKKTIFTPPIQISTNEENNGVPCKLCGQTFDDALALARHTKKEHKT
jgi:hypothetical protein